MSDTSPPWYHGCMSADAATAICKKVGQNGAFLVRQSQGLKGAFTLSMYFEEEVYHYRIGPTSGNHVMLESTQREFNSLEKLVQHYMSPTEEFMYPLTVAIYPSLVQQLNGGDENLKSSSSCSSSPLYVPRKELIKDSSIQRTQIPKPRVSPKPSASSKPVIKKPVAPLPMPSPLTLPSSPTGNNEPWPSPPPSADTKPVAPHVQPKPRRVRRTRSDSYESKTHIKKKESQPSSPLEPSFTTFGIEPTEDDKNLSRAATLRPRSCVFPSNNIELVFDIPDGSESKERSQPREIRRRTLSMDEIVRIRGNQNNDSDSVTEQRIDQNKSTTLSPKQSSQSPTKSGRNKKSKFQPIKHLFNRIAKGKQYPIKVAKQNQKQKVEKSNTTLSVVEKNGDVTEKESNDIDEKTNGDVFGENNNQLISEDYTPILCKTQFITTTDYNTSENALNFTKGTEIAVMGVRIDGWWYCYNKSTQESGWIYMDYLKPKNDTWFEAKPVETREDFEIYDQLNFGTNEFDPDFDDDNYCKYTFPVEDTNTRDSTDTSWESKVTVGTY